MRNADSLLIAAQKYSNEIDKLVFDALKLKVLSVLNSPENKHITGFVMAMGGFFFTAKHRGDHEIFLNQGETRVERIELDDDGDEEWVFDHDYAELLAPVFKIFEDWDDIVKLTGIPVRYSRDYVTGEWVETNDW